MVLMFAFIASITGLLALCVGCLAGYLGTQQWRRWQRGKRIKKTENRKFVAYNRIAELEQNIYGHMWPNQDSPWNQAAVTQMRAMDVQRRQKEAYRKQESAVVQTLRLILGRERNGR